MATFNFPPELLAQTASFALQKSGVQFRGVFNGSVQAVNFVSELWTLDLTLPARMTQAAGALEAMLNRLAGGVNKVLAYHPGRPWPLGTLRGSPLLQAATVRGASALTLNQCAAGSTLLAGDMLGIGGQLFQVADAATANSSGVMVVAVVNRARGVIAAGSAVAWSKPTVAFNCPAMKNGLVHQLGYVEGASIYLEESWQ